jgi:predicted transcriptional regulator
MDLSRSNRTSKERVDLIVDMIRNNPGNLGPSDIAKALGSTPKSIAVTICHMRADGIFISRCEPGKPVSYGGGYRLLEEPSDANRSK